jgi:hypothetical protein
MQDIQNLRTKILSCVWISKKSCITWFVESEIFIPSCTSPSVVLRASLDILPAVKSPVIEFSIVQGYFDQRVLCQESCQPASICAAGNCKYTVLSMQPADSEAPDKEITAKFYPLSQHCNIAAC